MFQFLLYMVTLQFVVLNCRPANRTGVVCDMSNNEVENGKLIEEFARAGRTGRRNALPDVFSSSHASCGTKDLTAALQKLQTASGTEIAYV